MCKVTVDDALRASTERDPKYVDPPHGVRDADKLAKIKKSLDSSGWVGYPILAHYDGNATMCFTGSHRIAAARELGVDVPVYVIEPSEDAVEDAWLLPMVDNMSDDNDRLAAIKLSGDDYAIAIMQAEINNRR